MTPGRAGFKPNNAELYDWLNSQILCTISTQGADGYPNAATVAFSQTHNLEFLIITDGLSRKAQNIMRNDQVAMTISNETDRYTIQLEGNARELSWDDFAPYENSHHAKLPFSLPFKDIPGQAPFIITPVHLRFSDVSVRPWELTDYAAADLVV